MVKWCTRMKGSMDAAMPLGVIGMFPDGIEMLWVGRMMFLTSLVDRE